MARLWRLVGDQALRHRVFDPKNPPPTFDGVVAGKGLEDELAGNMFVVITAPTGEPWYLRLPPDIADSLQEGEAVRVGSEIQPWLRPADRIIARFANDNGGVYDPVKHQQALENLRRPGAPAAEPTPMERVGANIRRLERLARYRLATRLPDGRWQVPADLLTQLEAREKTHPQHRLRVQPVAVWERQELGRAIAKRVGLAYVNDPPTFTGRAFACESTPSGAVFLRVVDEARRQFTLIPKPAGGERLQGQVVAIGRDGEARLLIRRGPEISR
jgi:hypothetical protein